MDDIARIAGVSASTVSRALSDSPLVAERTKNRIREIADRFEYQVDPRARSLALRKTDVIGVIAPQEFDNRLWDPFFSELLGAVAGSVMACGYQMLLARVSSLQEISAKALTAPGRVDGAIIMGQEKKHLAIDALSRRGDPIIVWGQKNPGQHYRTVGCDNVQGGYEAGLHLLDCGYRHIAFLGETAFPEVAARLEGLRRAFEARKADASKIVVQPSPFLSDVGYERAADLLQKNRSIDAIFAASDVLAIGAMSAATALGRRVPEDLGVVGFDDIQMAQYCQPALTTVRQDVRVAGRTLVDKLLDMISGEEITSAILPVELIVRESTRKRSRTARKKSSKRKG
ncbi:MAG: LacI family DNA-binding transcriptional regulator [Myxococcota bacterium]